MIRSKQLLLYAQLLLTFILCYKALGDEIENQATPSEDPINILDKVPSPSDPNAKGSTLAHDFAQQDQVFELIDLAEDNRELLNAKDANGWTPLHEAARNGHVLMVSFLLENGADVFAKTDEGEAARDLIHDKDVLLVEDGDSINERYKLVQTILLWAEGGQGLDGHTIKKKKATDELVLEFPGLPHALVQLQLLSVLEDLYFLNDDTMHENDAHGWTPLHEAARVGNLDIISFLVDAGGDVTKSTTSGKTVLQIAEEYAQEAGTTDHIDLIKDLIEKENNPEDDDEEDEENDEF